MVRHSANGSSIISKLSLFRCSAQLCVFLQDASVQKEDVGIAGSYSAVPTYCHLYACSYNLSPAQLDSSIFHLLLLWLDIPRHRRVIRRCIKGHGLKIMVVESFLCFP